MIAKAAGIESTDYIIPHLVFYDSVTAEITGNAREFPNAKVAPRALQAAADPYEAIVVPLFFEMTLLGWTNSYVAQIVPFLANPLAMILSALKRLNDSASQGHESIR